MTDTWDELWNEISIDGITQTSNISNSWVRNILNRIKVKGDQLKEKADKWDLLDKIGGPPKGDARIQWHIDMCDLRIKLEAVETWAQRNAKTDPKWLAEEEFIKLVKILEGQTLQNIGDKAQ